jgi:hypothetical protein
MNLYQGQQLRLPLHTCFEDKATECYIVTSATESLTSIAQAFNSTAADVCEANSYIFRDCYTKPLPKPHVGMELTVPRLYLNPPVPCKKIDGYWTCYLVVENDTYFTVATHLGVDPWDLCRVNVPNISNCDQLLMCRYCNAQSPCGVIYPDLCLKIGQVLTAPVRECKPKPGSWECVDIPKDFPDDTRQAYFDPTDLLMDAGGTFDPGVFCKANMYSLPACRGEGLICGPDQAYCSGVYVMSEVAFSGQRIKAPYFHCIPNDKSFCSTHGIIPAGSINLTVASWLCALGSGACNRDTIAKWDGNALLLDLLNQFGRSLPGPFDEYLRYNKSRPNTQEYYMPRGSLVPLDVDGEMCIPSPQEHICHKPLPGYLP